jgi:hypothetical protein
MSARFCDQCGSALQPSSRFCPQCGAKSIVTTAAEYPPQLPQAQSYSGASPSPPPPTTSSPDGQPWAAPPTTAPSPSTRPEDEDGTVRREQSTVGRKVAIGVGVIVLILFLLMLVPAPNQFSSSLTTDGLNPQATPLAPSDAISVSGSWSTTTGGSVTVSIVDSGGLSVYTSDSSSGTFSLNSSGAPFVFEAYSILPEDVQVSGTYWAPWINIGVP